MQYLYFALIVLAALVLLGLLLSIRIVQQYELGVQFRLGKVIPMAMGFWALIRNREPSPSALFVPGQADALDARTTYAGRYTGVDHPLNAPKRGPSGPERRFAVLRWITSLLVPSHPLLNYPPNLVISFISSIA